MGSLFEHIEATAKTDVGACRHENQDFFGVVKSEGLHAFFVADGMGGAKGGCLASSKTVEFIGSRLQELDAPPSLEELRGIVQGANSAIHNIAASNPKLHGMGTTLVGIAFSESRVVMVNVGDSRVYRFRGDNLYQLTCDHTVWNDLVRSGSISPNGDFANEISHMLTRSIGPDEGVEVDAAELDIQEDDIYLLCSDGLYNMVTERDIVKVLSTQSPSVAVESLVNLANEGGGKDNITALVVRILPGVDGLPECQENLEGLRLCDLRKEEPACQSLRDEDSKKLGLSVAEDSRSSLQVAKEIGGAPVKRSSDIHLYAIGAVLGLVVHMAVSSLLETFVGAPSKPETAVSEQLVSGKKVVASEIVPSNINLPTEAESLIGSIDTSVDAFGESLVQRVSRLTQQAQDMVGWLRNLEGDARQATDNEKLALTFEKVADVIRGEVQSLTEGTGPKVASHIETWNNWLGAVARLEELDEASDLSDLRDLFSEQFNEKFDEFEVSRKKVATTLGKKGTSSNQEAAEIVAAHSLKFKELKVSLLDFSANALAKIERETLEILRGREILELKVRQLEILEKLQSVVESGTAGNVDSKTIRERVLEVLSNSKARVDRSVLQANKGLEGQG